jgi:stage III sporulation protein AA
MDIRQMCTSYITEKICDIILGFEYTDDICEIRIRLNKPLCVRTAEDEYFLNDAGICDAEDAYNPSRSDIKNIMLKISEYSPFAFNDEVKKGYITLKNGFRIGIAGQAVYEGENIVTLKNISSLNFRIAKEVLGCGKDIYNKIFAEGVKNTLIVSPPGCGKTTLLRDLIRLLSMGGKTVGIADERSEIAGCFMGEPQLDVGIRTDVVDTCRKSDGINMLLRSMSPDVIAVDEVGTSADRLAIEDALRCGTKVICTAHGNDMRDISNRRVLGDMAKSGLFECYIFLCGRGEISKITDGEMKNICI